MEILKCTTQSKKEIYNLTRSAKIKKMSEVLESEALEVVDYCYYVDSKVVDGETKEVEVVSLSTQDGNYYATNSPSFIREFLEIEKIFEGEIPALSVIHGRSNSGKNFITVSLA